LAAYVFATAVEAVCVEVGGAYDSFLITGNSPCVGLMTEMFLSLGCGAYCFCCPTDYGIGNPSALAFYCLFTNIS
jgi:hypothetical protein